MSYRPITDLWILARAKLKPHADGKLRKYYGAYLGGFPERARVLIGCALDTPLLHVCGGMAKYYPYPRGFGVMDKTLDLDLNCQPDFAMDARAKTWPKMHRATVKRDGSRSVITDGGLEWGGILIDPPYSERDAERYIPGAQCYPNPNELVQTAINTLRIGYKVGIIHYVWPACPKNAMEVAHVAVSCGRNNRERAFVVYERTQ